MHDPKSLWRIARRSLDDSGTPWVSASRDSEVTRAKFLAWLDSLPVDPSSPCFIISGPHAVSAASWNDAMRTLFSSFPDAGDLYVLTADFKSVVILTTTGVARFIGGMKP